MARKKREAAEAAKAGDVISEGTEADRVKLLAGAVLHPGVNAANVVNAYARPIGGKAFGEVGQGFGPLLDVLMNSSEHGWCDKDMKRAERMLYAQAYALQSIFTNLAIRATKQEYMKHWEAYLRMALKAQNQCRMAIETLAAVKTQPVVFARQANINNGGQQQVNNGTQPMPALPIASGTPGEGKQMSEPLYRETDREGVFSR
jgi:hypothetical protein